MSKNSVIVSLTSHTKERLKNVPFFLYHSIFKYRYDFVKVVLTLYREDVPNMPDTLKDMVDAGLVELIVAEQDLKCHLKYFYAMKKYRDLPVITIDDDSIYPKQMIPDLLKVANDYPGVIIARSAKLIEIGKSYKDWTDVVGGVESARFNDRLTGCIRTDLNPEGYGGVLYPPNILEVSDSMLPEILNFPRADDIYLTLLEQRKHIRVVVPYYAYNKLDKCTRPEHSICTRSDNIRMIDSLVNAYLLKVL